jgi:hypothetical protein
MSEPFLERLSRFTPDAGKLDRDALLFAAGRASARPNRGWIAVASALASTQVLSLVLLWPHAAPHAGGLAMPVANRIEPRERPSPEELRKMGMWSAAGPLQAVETEDSPSEAVAVVESEPPLRAFAPAPPSLLN